MGEEFSLSYELDTALSPNTLKAEAAAIRATHHKGTYMFGQFGRILTAAAIAGVLAACSPSGPVAGNEEKTGEWVKSELMKMESQGAMGEVFAALRTAEPEIYAQLVDSATRAAAEGRSPFEAGTEVRPAYLARFVELGKTAKDEDINELLAFSGDQMGALMAIDPQLCVIIAKGGADKRIEQLPASMTNREMSLMARVIRAGQQNGAAASQDELNAWIQKFSTEYPAALEGLALMGNPTVTNEEASAICNGNITMMQALAKEEPATRAKLFRGLLQQS